MPDVICATGNSHGFSQKQWLNHHSMVQPLPYQPSTNHLGPLPGIGTSLKSCLMWYVQLEILMVFHKTNGCTIMVWSYSNHTNHLPTILDHYQALGPVWNHAWCDMCNWKFSWFFTKPLVVPSWYGPTITIPTIYQPSWTITRHWDQFEIMPDVICATGNSRGFYQNHSVYHNGMVQP